MALGKLCLTEPRFIKISAQSAQSRSWPRWHKLCLKSPLLRVDVGKSEVTIMGETMTMSSGVRNESSDINSLNENMFESRPEELFEKVHRDETPGGTERIVLAEDDPMIRKTIQHLLLELGYQVEAYTNGTEVLAAMSRDCAPIALLLTDHEMPGLTGYELAQRFRAEHPEVHVLLASGRSKESIFPDGGPQNWPPFLQKPYSLSTLACTLRDVLDGAAPD